MSGPEAVPEAAVEAAADAVYREFIATTRGPERPSYSDLARAALAAAAPHLAGSGEAERLREALRDPRLHGPLDRAAAAYLRERETAGTAGGAARRIVGAFLDAFRAAQPDAERAGSGEAERYVTHPQAGHYEDCASCRGPEPCDCGFTAALRTIQPDAERAPQPEPRDADTLEP